tara:strand:+ start:494 stop:655 length:162 start_codon:yes stop_codon:yes gene_type:complete
MQDKLKETINDLVKILNEKEMLITNLRLNNQSLLRENKNLKGEEADANAEPKE